MAPNGDADDALAQEIARMYLSGASPDDIERATGIKRQNQYHYLKKAGVEPVRKPRLRRSSLPPGLDDEARRYFLDWTERTSQSLDDLNGDVRDLRENQRLILQNLSLLRDQLDRNSHEIFQRLREMEEEMRRLVQMHEDENNN